LRSQARGGNAPQLKRSLKRTSPRKQLQDE